MPALRMDEIKLLKKELKIDLWAGQFMNLNKNEFVQFFNQHNINIMCNIKYPVDVRYKSKNHLNEKAASFFENESNGMLVADVLDSIYSNWDGYKYKPDPDAPECDQQYILYLAEARPEIIGKIVDRLRGDQSFKVLRFIKHDDSERLVSLVTLH